MNEDHLERLAQSDQFCRRKLESLALEGMNSGDPLPVGPDYWEEKHRRLEASLAARNL
jgi:hypothetical protein